MKLVRFKLTEPVHSELRSIGLRPGMEFTGELLSNKAIHFKYFYVIINQCTVWPDGYEILVDHNISIEEISLPTGIPIYSVECLFDPDCETEIQVIKVSDLTQTQKYFLNI